MTPDRPRRQRRGRSVRAMVVAGPTSPTLISSSDIGVYELDQLFRGFIGAGAVLLPDQAFANVILDHFGNETVQRTAAGGRLLQDGRAFVVCVHEPLLRPRPNAVGKPRKKSAPPLPVLAAAPVAAEDV